MIIGLTALTICFYIWGGLLLSGRFFSKYDSVKRIDKKTFIFGAVFSVLAAVALSFCNLGESYFSSLLIAEVVFITFINIYFDKIDGRMAIFFSFFYLIAHRLIAFIATAYVTICANDNRYLDPLDMKGCIIYLTDAVIILAAAVWVLYMKGLTFKVGVRIIAGIGILAMTLINLLLTIDSPLLNKDDVYVWMYYALGVMGAAFILQMRRQYDMEKELAEMKSNEAMILEREYHSLSDSYERNAKQFHDFRNHCGVLKNYLAKGKSDEALQYLEDLTGEGSSLSSEVWTGDETVDYLIGSKKVLAEQKGIVFDAEVEFPRNMNIKSSDLCAILGNLVDNAIEASSKVEDPDKRQIRLIIRRIQQMLVIKVENTYENKPVVVDGDYQTSKTDGGLHGWGIKSARTAAEKYDGMVQSSCTEDVFTTVVTLSF